MLVLAISLPTINVRADPEGPASTPLTEPEIPALDPERARRGAYVNPAQRRDPEHYRGRDRSPSPEEVLAQIPRLLFAPLAIIADVVLRRPIVALLGWLEEEDVIETIDYVLNPDPNVRWAPTLSLEAGVSALPGLELLWRNALVDGHRFEASGAIADDDFWAAAFHDRWRVDIVELGIRGSAMMRPERPFYGLGPDPGNVRAYFSLTRLELLGTVTVQPNPHARVVVAGGYTLEETGTGIEPSLESVQSLDTIPGFGLYELGIGELELTLDSRRTVAENNAVRFVGELTFGYDGRRREPSFLIVDLELEGSVEVSAPDRVLAAGVYAKSSVPLGEAAIPLTRLPIAAPEHHRGFIAGRFRGESSLVAELRYRYPIAYYVDLQWMASVGNVFARDGSDFDVGAMTGSLGVGLRTRRVGAGALELGVALGTSRFDSDLFVDSVRVYLFSSHGI